MEIRKENNTTDDFHREFLFFHPLCSYLPEWWLNVSVCPFVWTVLLVFALEQIYHSTIHTHQLHREQCAHKNNGDCAILVSEHVEDEQRRKLEKSAKANLSFSEVIH